MTFKIFAAAGVVTVGVCSLTSTGATLGGGGVAAVPIAATQHSIVAMVILDVACLAWLHGGTAALLRGVGEVFNLCFLVEIRLSKHLLSVSRITEESGSICRRDRFI